MNICKKAFIYCFILFLSILMLASCGKDEPNQIELIFNTNEASLVASKTLVVTKQFTLPENPKKPGYTFGGWYIDNLTFTMPFLESHDLKSIKTKSITVFAKWDLYEFTMSFDSNEGTYVTPLIYNILLSSILRPDNPTKFGHVFDGWYKDKDFHNPYLFDNPIYDDVTLYAKWLIEVIDLNPLKTDVLPIYSGLYGNTDGNLKNKGLAAYDSIRGLHYLSVGSSIYTYNPKTDETLLIFTLSSGGRPTYINLNKDTLYFIDSSNGYLVAYDLLEKIMTVISQTNNTYASFTQNWVNIVYQTIQYEQSVVVLSRYLIKDKTFIQSSGYGYDQINLSGTRVYYKPLSSLELTVVSYNGAGRSTIVNLTSLGVTEQYESLLYKVDNDYNVSYALILKINNQTDLYLYHSVNGLEKITIESNSAIHSLNYNGQFLYVITGTSLYQIDPSSKEVLLIKTLASNDTYLNIVNHWLYFGSNESTYLWQINPVTGVIKQISE